MVARQNRKRRSAIVLADHVTGARRVAESLEAHFPSSRQVMPLRASIIITTRNRASLLRGTLESFRRLVVPAALSTELLVVDNASSDESAEVIKSTGLPQLPVRYLYEPGPGQSNARNSGLAHARGEIILFTDDDVRIPPNLLEAMCRPILCGHADAVAGGVKLAPELHRPWMKRLHRTWLASTERLNPAAPREMIGSNMAFSRRVLSRVPQFDPELGPGALGFGDETHFSARLLKAGFVIAGCLQVSVEHCPDVARLGRRSWLASAWKRGATKAIPHAPAARAADNGSP